MKSLERRVSLVALGLFALVFTFLSVRGLREYSATVDEPQHLTAGYVALKLGCYHVDPDHPPLLRLWAALPLLVMDGVHLDTNSVDWLPMNPPKFSHEFLYQSNNADHLLMRARLMMMILGLLLGALVFLWSRQLYGIGPAVVVLLLFATEPNILAHASLVTTDLGVTLLLFASFYSLWRLTQQLTLGKVFSFLLCFGLAQVSKFSALAAWPMVLVLLAVRVGRAESWPCGWRWLPPLTSPVRRGSVALGLLVALLLVSWGTIWAVYDFRYAPAPAGTGVVRVIAAPAMRAHVPRLTRVVDWIDRHQLLPNACAQGFLHGQGEAQERPAYLLGRISETGWWYYFPMAFLLKTPMALLVLLAGGLICLFLQRETLLTDGVFLLVPATVYLVLSMTSVKLNIGVRHLLPIYPFVLLIAGRAVAWLWDHPRRALRGVVLLLCLWQAEELAFAFPDYLAFFNQAIGGPRNGYRYLADSNLDWGQDLKRLKQWMDEHKVPFINLSYFGNADPAYYGIECAYLPPIPSYAERRPRRPRIPGYVAISVQNLLGLSSVPAQPERYRRFLVAEPVAVIGQSIRVYWTDRPWW